MDHPKVFYEYYRQKMDARHVQPNITHKVLARMEEEGKLIAVVTQNIDGFHQKAGSKKVYELHGTTLRNYCAYTIFEFLEHIIRFITSSRLEYFTEVKEWNHGYIVVMAKYEG